MGKIYIRRSFNQGNMCTILHDRCQKDKVRHDCGLVNLYLYSRAHARIFTFEHDSMITFALNTVKHSVKAEVHLFKRHHSIF